MKRRAFLVGLASAPLWIRRAFGDASVGGARVGLRAGDAATTTTTTTRPTLVLVVPRDENERWERGAAFGEWLNHGDDRALAPLALVDVVCAPARDFGVSGSPLLLLVVGSTVHRLDGALPKGAADRRARIGDFVRKLVPIDGKSVGELAKSARERYVKKAPRGARWGRTTMCGAEYDEGPADAVDCGMGSVSEPARRFLDFYVKAS
jgi:hypothetical protein